MVSMASAAAIMLGGGLGPPSETSPQDAVRAAGRRGAGAPPSEASNPEIRAAGRRGRRARRCTAGGWPPRVRGDLSFNAPPSDASISLPPPDTPPLEPQPPPSSPRRYRLAAV